MAYDADVHPEHMSYWYRVAAVFAVVGVVMVAVAGARIGPHGHVNEFSSTLIIGYLGFLAAVICFCLGLRQARFPLARTSVAPSDTKGGKSTRP
jgi:drug/metabolite transporter (DMT)-like permease